MIQHKRKIAYTLFSFLTVLSVSAQEAPQVKPSASEILKVASFNTWLLNVDDIRKQQGLFGSLKQFVDLLGYQDLGKSLDYESRVKEIPPRLAETGADLIFLQEVWNDQTREDLIKHFASLGYPYAAFNDPQGDVPPWRKANGDPDLASRWGLMGNGLLTLSRYPIKTIDQAIAEGKVAETDLLHKDDRKQALVTRLDFTQGTRFDENIFDAVKKGAIHIEVKVPGLGWIDAINTHLGAITFSEIDDSAGDETTKEYGFDEKQLQRQRDQAAELVAFIQKIRVRSGHQVLILAGDLNAHPFTWSRKDHKWSSSELEPVYQMLAGSEPEHAQLYSSFHVLHGHETQETTYRQKNLYADAPTNQTGFTGMPDIFVDYIMANRDQNLLIPIAASIQLASPGKFGPNSTLSDHEMVVSAFMINPSGDEALSIESIPSGQAQYPMPKSIRNLQLRGDSCFDPIRSAHAQVFDPYDKEDIGGLILEEGSLALAKASSGYASYWTVKSLQPGLTAQHALQKEMKRASSAFAKAATANSRLTRLAITEGVSLGAGSFEGRALELAARNARDLLKLARRNPFAVAKMLKEGADSKDILIAIRNGSLSAGGRIGGFFSRTAASSVRYLRFAGPALVLVEFGSTGYAIFVLEGDPGISATFELGSAVYYGTGPADTDYFVPAPETK